MRLQTLLQNRHSMRMMTIVLLLAGLLFSPSPGFSDNKDLQDLLDKADSEGNIEQLLNVLEELKKNRISLNDADADELRQLPWLTSADIYAILANRLKNGPFRSLQELEPIIGSEKTASIIPCIYIRPVQLPRKLTKKAGFEGVLYSRYFRETTERSGITNGAYGGGNSKLYNRFQISAPHVNASLIQEKDIGEADFGDFTSLSVNVLDVGVVKNAVFGNYRLNLAQGLLIGEGRYFSKGSDPSSSVRLPSKLLLPYTSSSEYGFLQGGAVTLKLDPLEVTQFYSVNSLDARLNSSGVITGFDESGYHRTLLEVSRKDNVTETVAGANLLYHFHTGTLTGRFGGSLLYYSYSEPLAQLDPYAAGTMLSSATLYSIETDCLLGKASFFGEAAFSETPADASWITGVEYEVARGVSTIASLRRYGVHYYSPFAGAFAERGGGASNENGLYFGLNAKLSERSSVGACYDLYTFPSLSGDMDYPFSSTGHDLRGFASWDALPSLTWSLQLQQTYKEEARLQLPSVNGIPLSTSNADKIWTALPIEISRVRLDCDIKPSSLIKFRTRGEVKKVVNRFLAGDETFYGWLLYQQFYCEAGWLTFKGRFTLFNTEDYDAALYATEDDLPLTSSLGTYDGRGKSLYLIALLPVMKQMKIGVRCEKTWYSDRTVYSSGNDLRATSSPGSIHLGCMLTF
jgi:hypothetical protein